MGPPPIFGQRKIGAPTELTLYCLKEIELYIEVVKRIDMDPRRIETRVSVMFYYLNKHVHNIYLSYNSKIKIINLRPLQTCFFIIYLNNKKRIARNLFKLFDEKF